MTLPKTEPPQEEDYLTKCIRECHRLLDAMEKPFVRDSTRNRPMSEKTETTDTLQELLQALKKEGFSPTPLKGFVAHRPDDNKRVSLEGCHPYYVTVTQWATGELTVLCRARNGGMKAAHGWNVGPKTTNDVCLSLEETVSNVVAWLLRGSIL